MTTSRVTIGVLVYNGGTTLRRAVESAVNQSHSGCIILISDDGSTDDSPEIGRALAAEYANVTYFRQHENIGPPRNFHFLLQQADTPYFMWLAADDFLAPTYVERMLAELDGDPGLVTCVSKVQFIRRDGESELSEGTFPLRGDLVTNLAKYLSSPNDNSRLYGLHRTEALRSAFSADDYLIAFDWSIMAGSLLYGSHAEVQETLIVRDLTPLYAYMVMIREHARSRLERLLPVLPMTRDLIFRQKIPLRLPIIRALLHINIQMHLMYARTFYPRYAARVGPVLQRYLLWRLPPR
jgi:glycosyltransferase involved in cell wall biosynthesis